MLSLFDRAQELRCAARAELEPSGAERSTALARFEVRFEIPAKDATLLKDALLGLASPILEAEALACKRAVAWERKQPVRQGLTPWLVLELETLDGAKLSELRPRDWQAEYRALPRGERDRLRKKAERQGGVSLEPGAPLFRRGAPAMRAHTIIAQAAELMRGAVGTGDRVQEFRSRAAGTRQQLRYCTRPLPFSRRDGSPGWDLLLTSLRSALPINTTLAGGLPEPAIRRVLDAL